MGDYIFPTVFLKGAATSIGLNPLGNFLIYMGVRQVALKIAAGATKIGIKIGGLWGGATGAIIGGLITGAIGISAAITFARALIEGKGIGIDLAYTKSGIPYWIDINIR